MSESKSLGYTSKKFALAQLLLSRKEKVKGNIRENVIHVSCGESRFLPKRLNFKLPKRN